MKKLAIIGGGASGLCAAIEAKRVNPEIEITIFEKMKKCGKKISATGNGRCNFTNKDLSPKHFYGDTQFIKNLLMSAYSDSEAFFKELGVLTYKEDGRIYPRSQQASTIRDALAENIKSKRIIIKTEQKIEKIHKSANGFIINGNCFDAVILCGGGKSASVHGSDGSCYALAESLGHTTTPLYPALCSLVISNKDLNLLKGVRAQAKATLYHNGTALGEDCGEIQFTDKAVSGIPIMNLSHLCADKKGLKIKLDLCPEICNDELKKHLNDIISRSPEAELEAVLNGIVNIKLGYAVMNRAAIKPLTKCKSLKSTDIDACVKKLKCFEIDIKSAKGFDSAQITCGGINTSEINSQTMMSAITDGLFLCGEILDIHGDCGGYNLHLAWTTGRIAGSSAGRYLK